MKKLLLIFLVTLSACEGQIAVTGASDFLLDGKGKADTVKDPFPDNKCKDVSCQTSKVSSSSRVVRMTHRQWSFAVRDVLNWERPPVLEENALIDSFAGDTLSVGAFENFAENMRVNEKLWDDYREAAETLAKFVAKNPAVLNQAFPSEGAPDDLSERVDAFIKSVARRAYRHTLSEDEFEELKTLSEMVPNLYPGAPSFETYAQFLLRFILQSPLFLYRIELHSSDQEVVNLSGIERASRLSFALWNTIPDDKLIIAAETGELDTDEGVKSQVARMMADKKFSETIVDFHGQIFEFDKYSEIEKNENAFPDFNESLSEMYKEEITRFVKHIVLEKSGNWSDLLNSKTAFLNTKLAKLYNVEGTFTEDEYTQTLLPDTRAGLLTRLGFLNLKANAFQPNSIKRGVFINEHITCSTLLPVPDNAKIPKEATGNTNRELIHAQTKDCGAACHTSDINPPGFAFENFDAMGVYRTKDNNFPVDATGEWHLEGEKFLYKDGVDLSEKISKTNQSHVCYTEHWFEYLFGRLPTENDHPFIHKVGQASQAGDINVKDLVSKLVTSDLFLKRVTKNEK